MRRVSWIVPKRSTLADAILDWIIGFIQNLASETLSSKHSSDHIWGFVPSEEQNVENDLWAEQHRMSEQKFDRTSQNRVRSLRSILRSMYY